ncbi:hypothetical protein BKA66DRAFT_460026 [Pyrenochaeta sp. MPI-SDFR-AT-0127]|nr:hypothetical protein BKA66DRAFT_460026 [Pyrenochaeta sp. MPI-SDFR-AT-0127]
MFTNVLSLFALAGVAQSHMSMYYPPPLGAAPSINKQSTELDSEFNYPLGCCGAEGPTQPSPGLCRGHLDKFDTETASVTWEAGQDAHFQLTDYSYDPGAPGSTHAGGSCQVGFSIDKGATWKVAASYHGACPHPSEDGSPEAQTFDFKVPTGMPEGDALFAWVWLNREHEAFMNCAKVKIGAGSGNSTTPSQPSQPAQSGTAPKPSSQPTTQPEQPDDDEEPAAPVPTSRAGGRRPRPTSTTTTTVVTTQVRSRPSRTPSPDSDNDESSWSWPGRPHPEVKQGSRRYQVDGSRCECRRDELTLAARCSCEGSEEKRGAIERKALRLHRRTFYKRVDACNWDSAPAMEVSYYTEDAKCAPNAKINQPSSDDFELKWDVSCGAVEGGSEYNLKTMTCNMYGA